MKCNRNKIMNFKEIQIGSIISQRVTACEIEISRICRFFACSEDEVEKMYQSKSLDSEILLKWSKLLDYDFFRIYSQHLILYAPQGNVRYSQVKKQGLPQFKKRIYTVEMIAFILDLIEKNEKTKAQVIEDYKIPKTTLYKWIKKYET